MQFKKDLLDLDYFVYSAHKTATQTLTNTLRKNNFKAKHIHLLEGSDINKGEFLLYLEDYFKTNNRKLSVITVFREPISRYISSFFQYYGSRPLRLKEVESPFETIIYKNSTQQLQDKFNSILLENSFFLYKESIHELCQELQININEIPYSPEMDCYLYENDKIKLYIIKFDTFIKNVEPFLNKITETKVIQKNTNLSEDKFYKEKYLEFKASLIIPAEVVTNIYNDKKDIIDLLYPNEFDSIMNNALIKYSKK